MYFDNTAGLPQGQPQAFTPRTAINELDSFLSGLTEEERANILSSPEFGPGLAEYLNKFLFFLLQGELGALYIGSSASRREQAEVLKLAAHKLHANQKQSAVTEVERLARENKDLLKRIQKLEGGKA